MKKRNEVILYEQEQEFLENEEKEEEQEEIQRKLKELEEEERRIIRAKENDLESSISDIIGIIIVIIILIFISMMYGVGYRKAKIEISQDVAKSYSMGYEEARKELWNQIDNITSSTIEERKREYFFSGLQEGELMYSLFHAIQESEEIPEEIKIDIEIEYCEIFIYMDSITQDELFHFINKMRNIIQLYEGDGAAV